MGRVARDALSGRADERAARLARARQRRLELEKGRAERDARIDQAVADVYLGQEERAEAAAAVERADTKIGDAITRVLADGVPIAQVADLTGLRVNQVQKVKAAAVEARKVASTKTALIGPPGRGSAGAGLDGQSSTASGEHPAVR
jgi:hypothetical protein